MDWGTSGRRDGYRLMSADPFSLDDVEELDAVLDRCSITYGYYTDNLESATIVLTEESWQANRNRLIRIYHTVELPDGTTEAESLGTFFMDSAESESDGMVPLRRCSCYSTMWRLSQDSLAADYVAKKSSPCLTGLSGLITAEGATVLPSAEVTNSGKVHTQDARFAAGQNRLQCANTYAGWCGWQVGVDDYGRQTISQYVPPSNREVKHGFEDGADCTYLPQIRETFTGDVCNRVVALWSRQKDAGDGYGTSARAVADLPDSSPYSYAACGRRMTQVLKVTEPKTAAQLLAIAKEYLSEHDAATRYIEIEHVGIPHLRAGDVVTYTNGKMGDWRLLCEVTQMDMALGPLMLTRSKLKVV